MNGVRSTHGFLSVIVIGLLISSIISCGLTEEAVIEYQTDQYTDQDTVTNASSPRPKATAIATGQQIVVLSWMTNLSNAGDPQAIVGAIIIYTPALSQRLPQQQRLQLGLTLAVLS